MLICWSCKKNFTLKDRRNNDGHCPHCKVELDLETYIEKFIERVELIKDAEAYLDSFITDIEQSMYNCPECGDKEEVDKIIDLDEANVSLEKLREYTKNF
jgi:DNA-directed RNA polymerase subunit RPC12/RpoP